MIIERKTSLVQRSQAGKGCEIRLGEKSASLEGCLAADGGAFPGTPNKKPGRSRVLKPSATSPKPGLGPWTDAPPSGLVARREGPGRRRAQGRFGCGRCRRSRGSLLRSRLLGSLFSSRLLGSLFRSRLLGSLLRSRLLGSLFRSRLLGSLLRSRLLGSLLRSRLLGSLLRSRLLGSGLLGRSLLCRYLLGRGLLSSGLLHSGLLGRGFFRSCHRDLLDQVAKSTVHELMHGDSQPTSLRLSLARRPEPPTQQYHEFVKPDQPASLRKTGRSSRVR